jgi:PASTA domain
MRTHSGEIEMRRVRVVSVSIFLTVLAIAVLGTGCPPSGPSSSKVRVPDVVSLSLDEAEAAVLRAGFVLGTLDTTNSDVLPLGNVASQNPAGGEFLAPEEPVDITLSVGREVPPVLFDAGDYVEETASVIGPGGGTLSALPDSPLSGIYVDLPENALASDIMVTLGHTVGLLDDAYSATSEVALVLDAGGESFMEPVAIILPSAKDGEIIVPFRVLDTGRLDACMVTAVDGAPGREQILTFEAGTYVLPSASLSTAKTYMPSKIETGYIPRVHGFAVKNQGITGYWDGLCAGFTAFAQWYYLQGHSPLLHSLDSSIVPDSPSQKTAFQHLLAARAFNSVEQGHKSALAAWIALIKPDLYEFVRIRYALTKTGEPVQVGASTLSLTSNSHTLLAYAADGWRIYVDDSENPATSFADYKSRYIELVPPSSPSEEFTWAPYVSGSQKSSLFTDFTVFPNLRRREAFDQILSDYRSFDNLGLPFWGSVHATITFTAPEPWRPLPQKQPAIASGDTVAVAGDVVSSVLPVTRLEIAVKNEAGTTQHTCQVTLPGVAPVGGSTTVAHFAQDMTFTIPSLPLSPGVNSLHFETYGALYEGGLQEKPVPDNFSRSNKPSPGPVVVRPFTLSVAEAQTGVTLNSANNWSANFTVRAKEGTARAQWPLQWEASVQSGQVDLEVTPSRITHTFESGTYRDNSTPVSISVKDPKALTGSSIETVVFTNKDNPGDQVQVPVKIGVCDVLALKVDPLNVPLNESNEFRDYVYVEPVDGPSDCPLRWTASSNDSRVRVVPDRIDSTLASERTEVAISVPDPREVQGEEFTATVTFVNQDNPLNVVEVAVQISFPSPALTVEILSPSYFGSGGLDFAVGQAVKCEGSATDETGATIDGANLAWSVDGKSIGTGTKVTTSFKEPGAPTITLTATHPRDPSVVESASVHILVLPPELTIEILSPNAIEGLKFKPGDTVTCLGRALDEANEPVGGGDVTWFADGTSLGTGSAVNTSFAEPGQHTLTFKAVHPRDHTLVRESSITVWVIGLTAVEIVQPYVDPVTQEPPRFGINEVVECFGQAADETGWGIDAAHLKWSVSDGQTATGQFVEFHFSKAGSYRITLTATHPDDPDLTETDSVDIEVAANIQPKGTFEASVLADPDGPWERSDEKIAVCFSSQDQDSPANRTVLFELKNTSQTHTLKWGAVSLDPSVTIKAVAAPVTSREPGSPDELPPGGSQWFLVESPDWTARYAAVRFFNANEGSGQDPDELAGTTRYISFLPVIPEATGDYYNVSSLSATAPWTIVPSTTNGYFYGWVLILYMETTWYESPTGNLRYRTLIDSPLQSGTWSPGNFQNGSLRLVLDSGSNVPCSLEEGNWMDITYKGDQFWTAVFGCTTHSYPFWFYGRHMPFDLWAGDVPVPLPQNPWPFLLASM